MMATPGLPPPELPPRLVDLCHALAGGQVTAEALTRAALARIADPAGEGIRCFTRLYPEQALATAQRIDQARAAGALLGPLAGVPISIKDLFDVAGERTMAGSVVLGDSEPALQDAPVVARLRQAGAIIIGKTNMTEFAFSGLGLNPHYGTPVNPWDRQRIPGGSSSGAGAALPYGYAAAAIGTDTGGSVRIPAAFCRLVGFKPSSARIPRDGMIPLSTSLDSVGPLARSVACCALLDAVLAGQEPAALPILALSGLRFGVPDRFFTDGLAPVVAQAFDRALRALMQAGALVTPLSLPELAGLDAIGRLGGLAAPEAYAWHRGLLAQRRDQYDPRVRIRLEGGAGSSAADYIDMLNLRRALMQAVERVTAPYDALLVPSVAIPPPRFDELVADQDYSRINALVLRNTHVFNILDRPALSLPCSTRDELPVGLMVVGAQGGDAKLLALGQAVEACLTAITGGD